MCQFDKKITTFEVIVEKLLAYLFVDIDHNALGLWAALEDVRHLRVLMGVVLCLRVVFIVVDKDFTFSAQKVKMRKMRKRQNMAGE